LQCFQSGPEHGAGSPDSGRVMTAPKAETEV
jgi:hypothetical protein